MKRDILRLAAMGSIAAGMIFAQGQTAPSQTGPSYHAQQGQAKAEGQHNWRNHRAEMRQRFMTALNLSQDQKAMAKTIFGQARDEAKPVRMELRQNRQAMTAAVKANDKAQIEKLSAERGKLVAKLSTDRGEAMAKLYQVLTPAQRAKADQMHARFQARMRELRNERRGLRTNG
jgi:Spy/CpxP family protein refolding chaperone